MAIVNMSKFYLLSFDSEQEKLLDALQSFNYVHFNKPEIEDLDFLHESDSTLSVAKIDRDISNAGRIIETLRPFEPAVGMIEGLKKGNPTVTLSELFKRAGEFDFDSKYEEIVALEEKSSALKKEIYSLRMRAEELSRWSKIDIPLEDLRSFKNVNVAMGSVPTRYFDKVSEAMSEYLTVEIIRLSQDKNSVNVLIIYTYDISGGIEEILRDNGFTPVKLGIDGLVSDEIERVKALIRSKEEAIKANRQSLKKYVEYLPDIRAYMAYLKNEKVKAASSEQFLKSRTVDVIEGYVPTDMEDKLKDTLKDTLGEDYYLEIYPADRDDPNVPILLKNNILVEPFESLTEMYSMPKYNEIDPTPLFAPFYMLFAGMMVGDIGYGLVLFTICMIGLKSFNLDKGTRRMAGFLLLLSVSTIFWGFIYGSFFGDILGDAFPYKPIINPSEDYMKMITLSLGLGIFHIFFALGIKAYMYFRDGKPLDALYDVGFWYMALIGAGLALGAGAIGLTPTAKKIALGVMIAGMLGIVATGGREEESLGGRIGWGIYSLYGISSYIGDVVSYFRVMALVLSGSFIALAVNIIVKLLFTNGIFGMIGGVIIFVVFQLFNIFLSFLSAYVHTARLTFVEMFNKFYEGGGIPFRKMVAQSNYYNIKED